MRLFDDPMVKDLRNRVTELNMKLASIDIENTLEAKHETAKALDELFNVTKKLERAKIEQDRKDEEFARKEREIDHKIGLERQRMAQEKEAVTTQAKLEVREENLVAEKDRFTQEMKFMRERMDKEVDQLKDMTANLMNLIPKVNVDRRIREEYKGIEAPKE